ncbi:MAG: B12-binding domain-containing radical SAM protein [Anaerolineales bacterium]|nr:B12-binding domain-containing radical SAM protein [Anaerolineales bacterium]
MDLLLTHGYFLYTDPHELQVMKPYPPLGILYISSHLKAKGFDVQIFDSTFSSKDAFREYVKRERPSLVGLYCNLMTRHNVVEMAQICKENGATVIVGGPEPVNYPEEYLNRGADLIVSGEGELTLEALIPHLARHGLRGLQEIPGIIYRDQDGFLVRTPAREQIKDLSAQPFPDRAAIDIPRYVDVWRTHHGTGSVSLITARGCPYKCKWCSHSVFGYTHRRRTALNTADELELILGTYKPDIVWYADDVFTMNHRWLTEYAAELKRRNLRAPFETISREDRLNEQVIQTLAEMGCYRIWLGSESGSQRILDAMERKTSAEGTRDMAKLLKKHGIGVGMFIMLGYDGETMADLEETVHHLKQSNPDTFLTTIAYPIKGTPYYNEVQDRVIPLKAWDEGSDRDFTVAGRYSRKFYSHATRWMVGEVDLNRQLANSEKNPIELAKSFVNAKLGRLGMALTKGERENGGNL